MDDEQLIRNLILDGTEKNKVEFKEKVNLGSNQERMGLAKLISAIANTHDLSYDNFGYVVLGAQRREIAGGIDELSKDNFSAGLQQSINAFLDPPVRFYVKGFKDAEKGWFGVIVIPPSTPQEMPHFIARDGEDNGKRITKGQCYVRYGDTTALAQKNDYERMYAAKFNDEIESLRTALAERERKKPKLDLFAKVDGEKVSSLNIKLASLTHCPSVEERVEREKDKYRGAFEETPARTSAANAGVQHALGVNSWMAGLLRLSYDKAEVEEYLPLYEKYLVDYDNYLEQQAQMYPLDLVICNDGVVPAENVTLKINFTNEVEKIYSESELPKKPKCPKAPQGRSQLLGGMSDYASFSSRDFAYIPNIQSRLDLPHQNVRGPFIEGTTVRFEIGRLPHCQPISFAPIILSFTPVEYIQKGFHFNYTIYADNQEQPQKGDMSVCVMVVKKDWQTYHEEQDNCEDDVEDEAN